MCQHFLLIAVIAPQSPALDLAKIPADLSVPGVEASAPAAGKRVQHYLERYQGSELHHLLYLPTDWQQGKRYPVIFEYPGNQYDKVGYRGRVEDCKLGYGASGGRGVIWVSLPFVNSEMKKHQLQWWGDRQATIDYCRDAVDLICRDHGGDRSKLILAGFSRGAIACNYIGLANDDIAKLWRGFIVHSHYDGVRRWPYADSDRPSALERLKRLKGRPQFISHESSVAETEKYLKANGAAGTFTFMSMPFAEHTDSWVLRDIAPRQALRDWLKKVLDE